MTHSIARAFLVLPYMIWVVILVKPKLTNFTIITTPHTNNSSKVALTIAAATTVAQQQQQQ